MSSSNNLGLLLQGGVLRFYKARKQCLLPSLPKSPCTQRYKDVAIWQLVPSAWYDA